MARFRLELLPWLAVTFLATWFAPRLGVEWPIGFLGGLLVVAVAAILGEVGRARATEARPETFDSRPADGVVPVVPLDGALGTVNAARPGLLAFRSIASVPPISLRLRSRVEGRPLKGRIGVFSVFVGRDRASWDDREIAEAYDSLERMGRWLEREAGRWSIALNVELIGTYFVADDPLEAEEVEIANALDPFETILDEADSDVKGIASASRAAAQLGFADLAALIDEVDPRVDHDATLWIIHLLRSGRSSAITADLFDYPGVGVALCYARESACSGPLAGLPYVDPVTLAHEMLHLFGAKDKYGTALKSFPADSVSSRDVMRLSRSRLGQLRVDPLTASEIGWLDGGDRRPEMKKTRHRP